MGIRALGLGLGGAAASLTIFASACCFTPQATPTPPPVISPPAMPAIAPPTPAAGGLPGAGALPTPPLVYTGVVGPQPTPGASPGSEGEILTSGTATVRLATGSLPGVAAGTQCSYAQFRVDPATHGFDCRWNVTCGANVVYGLGEAGYQVCTNPAWPPGVLMMDPNMTGNDGDPMFIFNAGGLTVGDDTGPLGAFTLTLTVP